MNTALLCLLLTGAGDRAPVAKQPLVVQLSFSKKVAADRAGGQKRAADAASAVAFELLAKLGSSEPPAKPARKVNPKVPVDLETICLKAMEKDPDGRYQTAGALAEDLRRYVNRFAISARRAGTSSRRS